MALWGGCCALLIAAVIGFWWWQVTQPVQASAPVVETEI